MNIAPVLVRIDPSVEPVFTVGIIVFLLWYLILLIRDLENPFAYYVAHSAASVSLKPLEDCIARLTAGAHLGERTKGETQSKRLPRSAEPPFLRVAAHARSW